MEIKVLHYVFLIGITVLAIIHNSLSFSPIRFHCSNYVLNTYLYFILSWGIIMATNSSLEKNNIELHYLFSGPFTILLMVSSMALLFGLIFVPPSLFFTKHLLFILEMVLLGIIIYPYYKNNKKLFSHVALTTLIVLILLTFITYNFSSYITDSWGTYLFYGLLAIIIARLIEIFRSNYQMKGNQRIISYISIILFSLYIMYDTKQILINSKNCVKPDYINESLSLILDSINLLQNIFLIRNE